MKLLLDENLSPRLLRGLVTRYPGSTHVRDAGLASADDGDIWRYAGRHGLTIVSKDSDFHQRSLVSGHPPKVVWLQIGNCSTDAIADVLARHRTDLEAFQADAETSFLILD